MRPVGDYFWPGLFLEAGDLVPCGFAIPSLTSSGWSRLCCDAVARWDADHTKLDTAELVASITGPSLP